MNEQLKWSNVATRSVLISLPCIVKNRHCAKYLHRYVMLTKHHQVSPLDYVNKASPSITVGSC